MGIWKYEQFGTCLLCDCESYNKDIQYMDI